MGRSHTGFADQRRAFSSYIARQKKNQPFTPDLNPRRGKFWLNHQSVCFLPGSLPPPIEFCEIMTFELQPPCEVMRKPLSQCRARRDLFAPPTDLCLPFETPRPDPIYQHATAVVTYGFSVGCIATTVIERAPDH